MISFLRSPKAELDIQVSGESFYPGRTINAGVTLSPKKDFHIRKGILELLCIETYWDVVTYYVSSGRQGGSYPRSRNQKFTRPLVNLSEPFLADIKVSNGSTHYGKVKFEIPDNA